ncbi:hypothetical protein [Propionispora vibrioides]|uniref:hypothetical protein n=1 Tax=Propionispora vibrioides TaxID=112903 RepID=UPI0015A66571|nr:hypothetical protein [Propionispora vibrioides]
MSDDEKDDIESMELCKPPSWCKVKAPGLEVFLWRIDEIEIVFLVIDKEEH